MPAAAGASAAGSDRAGARSGNRPVPPDPLDRSAPQTGAARRVSVTAFWSRLLVTAGGLPVVLGVVWLGGWWLFAAATVVTLIALHELYAMARPLRPVLLAGYAGALATLLGAELGGPDWVLAGFLSTLPLAFLLKGIAETRQSVTVAVSATALGTGWIGAGIAHVILLRDLGEHGRLATFAVLLGVFAGDSAAYLVGRLVGRHKLAPTLSPGKTWEGFVAGIATTVFVVWISLYRTGFLDDWRSLVLGGAVAIAAVAGDLFESLLKRDVGVKDTGRLLGGHGGMLDRIDALLFAGAAAFYVILAFGEA
jgi:phosphatidate cytidylyltransferase